MYVAAPDRGEADRGKPKRTMRPDRPGEHAATSRAVALVLVAWFLGVATVGHAGLLEGAPALLVGGYVAGVTLLPCLPTWTVAPLRAWLRDVDMRPFVLLHFARLSGIALPVPSVAKGGLPTMFADRDGHGDIFGAITALALAIGLLPAVTRFRRGLLLAWNVVGTLDLFLVVGTGVSIQLSGSPAMAPTSAPH